MPEPTLLTDSLDLADAVGRAAASGRVALDTEFLRERTYRARLCLVQVATRDALWLADPIAGVDLAPVADLVGAREVEVVVHAGKQDLELLHDLFGVVPANVFDVQVAAAFAGYGAALPYGRLVETVVGVALEKGESYTDWCKRPLTDAQLRYAADDVRHLIPAADRLEERLTELGRHEWCRDELKALEDPSGYGADPADAWKRVAGRGSLSPRATAVLREVARWREETAMRRDVPRGWVVKDPTLIEIARRMPTSKGALASIRGLSDKEVGRSGGRILAAVAHGKNAPPVEAERSPSRGALARARLLSGLADAVVRARCDRAGLATELVATRGELETLLAALADGRVDDDGHRLLRGWRRELAGDAVLDLARGRIAVKAVDRPPFVEEVPLR